MSWTAKQLCWAIDERSRVNHMSSWYDWDDECRYLAGLLIAGGNYDDTSEVE